MSSDRVMDLVDTIGRGLEEYAAKGATSASAQPFRELIQPSLRLLLDEFDEAIAFDLEKLCTKWQAYVGGDLLTASTAQQCIADVQVIITQLRTQEGA